MAAAEGIAALTRVATQKPETIWDRNRDNNGAGAAPFKSGVWLLLRAQVPLKLTRRAGLDARRKTLRNNIDTRSPKTDNRNFPCEEVPHKGNPA